MKQRVQVQCPRCDEQIEVTYEYYSGSFGEPPSEDVDMNHECTGDDDSPWTDEEDNLFHARLTIALQEQYTKDDLL